MRTAVCFLLAACLFSARAADTSHFTEDNKGNKGGKATTVVASAGTVAAGVSPASKGGILPPGPASTVASVGSVAAAAVVADADYVPDDKYKLRVGDKISFQILEDRHWDDKAAPVSVIVSDSGEMDVPYIGRVAAADKTCKQLTEEIKKQLEKTYYHRATVVVGLDLANKFMGRIYVWGQVRNQGAIDIAANESLTVGKAILRAGGFADFANKKKVKVVRGGSDSAGKQTFELNMVEILEEGKTEKDVPLQPDDFVIVPSRLVNF